jgi:hypothetical protein
MECVYCKKSFSTPYVLRNHQKTVRSCIQLQEEIKKEKVENVIFECKHCTKKFTTKGSLTLHYNSCKKIKKEEQRQLETQLRNLEHHTDDKMEQISYDIRNYKEELEYELRLAKEEIKELKQQIHNKTPPRVKNKIINNNKNNIETNIEQQNITIYQVMSPEHVAEFFKSHYNLETLLGGQKALARFLNDGFLKEAEVPVYTCGDRSRQKFYIVKDGKKIEDTDCDSILELTSPGMPAVKQVYSDALFSDLPEDVTEDDIQDNYRNIISLTEDRTEFKSELSKIVSDESVPKGNFKRILQQMKDDMLPNESKRQSEPILDVKCQEPIRNEIGGFSLGKLDTYRKAYRERKSVIGEEAVIKAPLGLSEQFKDNPSLKEQYINFITS